MESQYIQTLHNVKVLVVLLAMSGLIVTCAHGAPLPPVQCNTKECTISNAVGIWPDRIPCKAESVVYPKTEREVLMAVAEAAQRKQKIKVGTQTSHAAPKLPCPGGEHGVIISSRDYDSIVSINASAMTVTAQGGVQLRHLLDEIAKENLSLPQTPYWDGLTLAGMIGAGAHGSGLFGKGSALSAYITAMSLIVPANASEGYAKIVVLEKGDEDLKAARIHLGVLGFVSLVTLQLQPLFKRHVTKTFKSDADLEHRILGIAKGYEFGDVEWFPSQHEVIYRLDYRVPLSTPGEAVNKYSTFQPILGAVLEEVRRADVEAEALKNVTNICQRAKTNVRSYRLGEGFQNNGSQFGGYPVIGYANLIQSAGGCQNAPSYTGQNMSLGLYCAWESTRIKGNLGFSFGGHVPLRNIKKFILDVKRLRELYGADSLCRMDTGAGVLMRFVKKTEDIYLGYMEDMVEVGFSYYRADDPRTPRLFQDVLDEFEQLMYKYRATPHWGKNRNSAFEGIHRRYPDMNKFLAVKDKFDPKGLFSSTWSDGILGVGEATPSIFTPYCAFEGLCTCSRDEHCAPEKGYFCESGRIYKGARVCRLKSD